MTSSLLKTPLADWHAAHGGRMVDFAGWWMPVQYDSIVAEHLATRRAAGLFDVSHMGRLRLDGPGSAAFLDRLLTRQVCGMSLGKIRYSCVCNEAGGILDDVLVYHLQEHGGGPFHLLVVNASNREKILGWLWRRGYDHRPDVRYRDDRGAGAGGAGVCRAAGRGGFGGAGLLHGDCNDDLRPFGAGEPDGLHG
jgi:aminomethyltransferase